MATSTSGTGTVSSGGTVSAGGTVASGGTTSPDPTPEQLAAAAAKAESDAWVYQTSVDVGWVPPEVKEGDPAPVPPAAALSDGDKLWIRREIEGSNRGITPEQLAELNP